MALYFGKGEPLSGLDSFTKLLMHMDGTDGSPTFIEETGLTVTRGNQAQIDTAQFVFGGASGLFDGDDYITVPGTNFGLGTGDFVVEAHVRIAAFSTWQCIISFRDTNNTIPTNIFFGIDSTQHRPVMHQSGNNRIIGGSDLLVDTWYHIALIRSSGVDRLFVGGSQTGSDFSDTNNYSAPGTLQIAGEPGIPLSGWLDEFRISIGTDRGWFSGFTPPTSPY